MGRIKRMGRVISILKDKVSIIKATLILTARPTTAHHVAILRATTHYPSEPPPEYTVDDILTLGHHHITTASAVVAALLCRLHRTRSAHVALKCLLTLHHILARGSPLLRDQITSKASFLNLPSSSSTTTFRDASDADTWQLSWWVRWYAEVLQQILIVCRSLGFFFLSPLTSQSQNRYNERVSLSKSATLLKELTSLVSLVEQICRAPESLHYQRIGLIYEVMKLVGEDYRMTMREIYTRITIINKRVEDLSEDELSELLNDMTILEGCKEKVFLMFLNKKKNDGAWELIAEIKKNVDRVNEMREGLRLVRFQGSGSQPNKLSPLVVVPVTRGKRWLDVEWNPLVASFA